MSLFDILFRVDEICKKYDKYDPDKQRELNTSVGDAFSRVYSVVDAEIENALRKSDMEAMETNRAKKVAMNADIRIIKARLAEEVAKLQKLATKESTSGFWAPTFKWGISIANIADFAKPPDKLSYPQQIAVACTGVIWSRYSTVITPKNWNLFSVNVAMAGTGLYQLSRKIRNIQQIRKKMVLGQWCHGLTNTCGITFKVLMAMVSMEASCRDCLDCEG